MADDIGWENVKAPYNEEWHIQNGELYVEPSYTDFNCSLGDSPTDGTRNDNDRYCYCDSDSDESDPYRSEDRSCLSCFVCNDNKKYKVVCEEDEVPSICEIEQKGDCTDMSEITYPDDD